MGYMDHRAKKTLLFVGLFSAVASVSLAQAYPSPIEARTVGGILNTIVTFATNIAKPLAVIAILYAAFLYVTAGGSEDKVSKAHKALIYGIIGLFVILSVNFLRDVLAGVAGRSAGQTFADFIKEIARVFGFFIVAASVIAILYSAFLFLTAGGEPDKVTTARQALLYAAIGVAVAVLSFAIPGLIGQIVPQ